MIWGKTEQEIRKARDKELEYKKRISGKWIIHFAWSPVWLINGQMLWLEKFERCIKYSWSNSGHEYQVVTARKVIK